MVNRSTKERAKKGKQDNMTDEKPSAEETSEACGAEKNEESTESEETALQAEVIDEEKAHGDEDVSEEVTKEKANAEEPARKGRGRPKKTDSSEPAAKKAKKTKKERAAPERTSSRVANQRAGVKLQETEELPERKRSPTKKASKSAAVEPEVPEQNGTAVEV